MKVGVVLLFSKLELPFPVCRFVASHTPQRSSSKPIHALSLIIYLGVVSTIGKFDSP